MSSLNKIPNVPWHIIQSGLKSDDWRARRDAMEACVGHEDVPLRFLIEGLRDKDLSVRLVALGAFGGRTVPISFIMESIDDNSRFVRQAALVACIGREDAPLNIIRKGAGDIDPNVRRVAFEACIGHGVPQDIIDAGLGDENMLVRQAAMRVAASQIQV